MFICSSVTRFLSRSLQCLLSVTPVAQPVNSSGRVYIVEDEDCWRLKKSKNRPGLDCGRHMNDMIGGLSGIKCH